MSTKYSIKIVATTPCRHHTASSSLRHRLSVHATYSIFCIYLTKLHDTVQHYSQQSKKENRNFLYGWWNVHKILIALHRRKRRMHPRSIARTFSLLQLIAPTQHNVMITMMMEFKMCGVWRLYYTATHQAMCTARPYTQYYKYTRFG